MSNRKSSVFYTILVAFAFTAMGMVLASKFGLTPISNAGPINIPSTNTAPLTGAIDATTFRTIAKAENPAVVSITAFSTRRATPDVSEMFQFPGLQQQAPRRRGQQPETMAAGGSGFIIDKANGYILTNNHVVDGASDIRIRFFDNDPINDPEGQPAKLIGRDVLTDSALIQLVGAAPTNVTQVRFGDSAQLDAGDWVMAIGNPFSYSNTVTVGVVSAVSRVNAQLNPVPGRDLEYIQTDAAINHGNSGGPLLNIRGEVIGINTAIISDGESGGNLGIGFAVPINTVRDVLPSLKTGKVARGRIGVSVDKHKIDSRDIKELGLTDAAGAQITLIVPGGPAAKAGVKPGDIVTEFNGKAVKDSNSLVEMVVRTAPGTTVPMKLVRSGKPQSVNITIEELNVDDEIGQTQETVSPQKEETPEPKETGFGMTVEAITPQITRRLSVPAGRGGAIVSDLDPRGAAALGGMAPTDVILAVNDTPVTSPDQVLKALEQVASGRIARVLVWRTLQGQRGEQMITMRKK